MDAGVKIYRDPKIRLSIFQEGQLSILGDDILNNQNVGAQALLVDKQFYNSIF